MVLQETQTETSSVVISDNLQTKVSTDLDVTQDVLIIQEEPSLEVKLQSNDVNVLAKYIQGEKLNAVMKKREGDKAGAVEAVKAYKQLDAKRAQLLSQIKQTSETEVKSDQTEVESSTSSQKLDDLSTSVAEKSSLSQQSSEISPQNQEIIDTLNQRFKQYKEAAVAFKTSDVSRAKEFLSTATIIYKTMKTLEHGSELPEGWEIPGEPDISQREVVPVVPSTLKNRAPVNVTPVSTPKKKVLTVLDNATNLNVMDEYEQSFAMVNYKVDFLKFTIYV